MGAMRIGILGCGNIAQYAHLPTLSKLPGVAVTAVADPDESLRVKALQAASTAKDFADWHDVVRSDAVDAVVICLPTGLHAEAAVAAFEAGKHVYVEKPLAATLPDARRVHDAWQASGRVGMVGFNYRFHPLMAELKRQIGAGRIGRPVSVRSVFSSSAIALPGWKATRKSGGGVLLDLGSHDVDLLRFLLDSEVEDVFARIDSVETEADTATLNLRAAGGVLAHSFFSLRSLEEHTVEVFGTSGKLAVDLYRSTQVDYSAVMRYADAKAELTGLPGAVLRRGKKMLGAKVARFASTSPYQLALQEFVAAVAEKRQPASSVADGLSNALVIDAAERSAASGENVSLPSSSSTTQPLGASVATRPDGPASETGPALTVVLIATESWGVLATTLRALRAQTCRERIELLIVAESQQRLALDRSAVEGFGVCRVVEIGPIQAIGPALAAGVRHASAPVVAFGEDHSFPEPTWAEALLEAHRGPWAAVGPVILNANPATATSWADLVLGYGPWLNPAHCGERTHLPGHNSSYKRDALLAYGPRLEDMLEAETVLQWDLRRQGHRLYQSAEVRTRHTNFSLLSSFTRACFLNGRVFGSARAMSWGIGRRLVYTAAAPLIPVVRFAKMLRDGGARGAGAFTLLRMLPVLALGLLADAFGQMLGYSVGVGSAATDFGQVEFFRERHVTAGDRAAVFASPDPQGGPALSASS